MGFRIQAATQFPTGPKSRALLGPLEAMGCLWGAIQRGAPSDRVRSRWNAAIARAPAQLGEFFSHQQVVDIGRHCLVPCSVIATLGGGVEWKGAPRRLTATCRSLNDSPSHAADHGLWC